MVRAGMQSRAVEGVGMVIGKRAAARGSAGDAEEAGTRLSRIESKKRKAIFLAKRYCFELHISTRLSHTSLPYRINCMFEISACLHYPANGWYAG